MCGWESFCVFVVVVVVSLFLIHYFKLYPNKLFFKNAVIIAFLFVDMTYFVMYFGGMGQKLFNNSPKD